MGNPTELIQPEPVELIQAGRAAAPSPGDLAAAVFECLDDGASLTDIVVRLAVAPEKLEALSRTWARLRGGVLIFPDTIATLTNVLPGPTPTSAANIVKGVVRLSKDEPRMCTRCKTEWAQFCYSCPEEAAAEALRSAEPKRKGTTR